MRLLALAVAAALSSGPALADDPVKVIIVGTVHFANPSQDSMNVAVDDVLSAGRQAEIAEINEALARFAPTAVAVEWPEALATERYANFLAGTLEPSRNEVVQIGFNLARAAKLDRVHGIDVEGDFPFEAVQDYAKLHGQTAIIDAAMKTIADSVAAQQAQVDKGSLGALLRYLNDPARIASDNDFYRVLLRVGGGDDQPGARLLAAWQTRNLLTCARLVQLARPGDRIVVIFGAGHGHLLRQCVTETPGFDLVEANDYLPE